MSGGGEKSIGRDLAVEALIDMHERGPAFRVGKIMDEAPPAALSARPVQVTRSMLLDRARSLSKYENKGEYLDVSYSQNITPKDGFSTPESKGVEEDDRSRHDRVMRHHAKIIKAKNTAFRSKLHKGTTSNISNSAQPPSQLVASLRKIYGPESVDRKESSSAENVLPGLLQSILDHKVMVAHDQPAPMAVGENDEIAPKAQTVSPVANIETIVGNACTLEENDSSSLQGLLIAAMSVLSTCILSSPMDEKSTDGSDDSTDLNVHPEGLDCGLQVSGPLSLVFDHVQDSSLLDDLEGNKFDLNRELLQYFREASAVYEERIDIQKASIVSARARSIEKGENVKEAETARNGKDGFRNFDDDEEDMPGLMQRRFGDDISSSDESAPFSDESSDSEQEIDDADSAENIGGGNLGDMERPLLEVNNSSSSDSDLDEEAQDDGEEDLHDAENEAHLLEEALAMSLAELNSAISAVAGHSEHVVSGEANTDSEVVREGNSHSEGEEQDGGNDDPKGEDALFEIKTPDQCDPENSSTSEKALPMTPVSPNQDTYIELWNAVGTNLENSITSGEVSRNMDPSMLVDYGKLPPSKIFIFLLRMIVQNIEKKMKGQDNNNKNMDIDSKKNSRRRELETMLRDLSFGELKVEPKKIEARDDFPFSSSELHLIVASLHILASARLEVFDNLCGELKANDDKFSTKITATDEYNTDDPAFAMNTEVTTEVAIFESLGEKGMVRKAAAAAHTFAVQREFNQQKIESLEQVLHLLSTASYLMLRCLRLLFQHLATQQCILDLKPLSSLAKLRLSSSLTKFMSASVATKCHDCLSKISLSTEDRHRVLRALSPRMLMIEACNLWGECAPNLISSSKLLNQKLRHTFDAAMRETSEKNLSTISEIDEESGPNISLKFPWYDGDENLLKLRSLCKRIQTTGVLDILVPRPTSDVISSINDPLPRISATIASMGKEISKGLDCDASIAKDIEKCYYSMCHRFNKQILLWDGACHSSDDLFGQKNRDNQENSTSGSKLRIVDDSELIFDATKCADSIAILPSASGGGSVSVNQRANKVWGTVLSTKFFKPKSGVHRWAVKLDKCERGHIFIGVGTARTSTKTYVGGDKNGWGVIGTQALWHDRKKIRSDYGRTFRTGAIIVVSLDTDAGTLSFSLWNEDNSESTSTSSQSLQDFVKSEEKTQNGTLEDWGIAFEGLPLDTRLFPAVGMYQRDDKATLVGLQQNDLDAGNENEFQSGSCFYPQVSENESLRQWNSEICNEGIVYATNMMNEAVGILNEEEEINTRERIDMFETILPSIASSMSSFPSTIPILSGRAAFNLLPQLVRCIKEIEKKIHEKARNLDPTFPFKSGQWTIKASASNSAERFEEEHIVDLKVSKNQKDEQVILGCGVDTISVPANKNLSISGSCRGNLIHLVEKRLDNSKPNGMPALCTVEARLHLDGARFEGKFYNDDHATYGVIVGIHESKIGTKNTISGRMDTSGSCESGLQRSLIQCSYLLGLAVDHLILILGRGAPTRDFGDLRKSTFNLTTKRRADLANLLTNSPILRNGLSDNKLEKTFLRMESIHNIYQMPEGMLDSFSRETNSAWYNQNKRSLSAILKREKINSSLPSSIDEDALDSIDAIVAPQAGGFGSLSSLHPSYGTARKFVIKVLLQHTGQMELLSPSLFESNSDVVKAWRLALQIVESRVRASIMAPGIGQTRADACEVCCHSIQLLSKFMVKIGHPLNESMYSPRDFIELYQNVTTKDEIDYLIEMVEELSHQGVLKLIGLKTMKTLLNSSRSATSTRETILQGFHHLLDHKVSTQKHDLKLISIISGSYFSLQHAVSFLIKDMFFEIQRLATEILEISRKTSDIFMHPTTQSLLFAVCACFFLPAGHFEEILNEEIFWELMQCIFSNTLHDLKEKDSTKRDFRLSSETNLSKLVLKASLVGTNLDLLQSSISLLHVVLYQLLNAHGSKEMPGVLTKPISILKTEILYTMKCLRETERKNTKEQEYQIATLELERWKNVAKESSLIVLKTTDKNSRGTNNMLFPRKPDSRISSLSNYLSHLFDAFSTMLGSHTKASSSYIDIQFLKHLLNFVVQSDRQESSPRAIRKFKVRILKLLRIALSNYNADKEILSLLFSHLENIMEGMDEKDYVEMKETVSLIRHLYNSSYNNNVEGVSWQDLILSKYAQSSGEIKTSLSSIFGGMPGLLVPGAFVLLKPVAAKNLQTTSLAKTSSENRSVAGNHSPVAGGGIEGIVSGLCRKEASGGIICKVDEATSTCEVVLFDRNYGSRGNIDNNISIRAVRVPFSDTTAADENGILFDKKFPVSCIDSEVFQNHLLLVLSRLRQPNTNFDEISSQDKENYKNVKHSALASFLRSSILILSNPSLIKIFVEDEKSRAFFAKILELASFTSLSDEYPVANSMCSLSLKALPEVEARYWHLNFLQVEMDKRKLAIISSKEKLCTIHQESNKSSVDYTSSGVDKGSSKSLESSLSDQIRVSNSERSNQIAESTENESNAGSINEASEDDEEEEEEGNDNEDEDDRTRSEENEELAHLREAAIVQMLELGLPRSWSEYALRRVGGTNIEAAVHFCLERGGDMERLLAEDQERSRGTSGGSSRRRNPPGTSQLLQQLIEMGFPSHWCTEALDATGHNVDEALTWILTNGERLSALDEGDNDAEEDSNSEGKDENESSDDDTHVGISNLPVARKEDSKNEENISKGLRVWPETLLCPVRSISGKANIDAKTLEISGLPSGGFSSVGTKGVLLTEGKWYYECVLITSGCIQVGWADSSFSGHCQADRGDGCGDGPSSWAYDGWRRYRWHSSATEWGCRWQDGDVVGCLVDMDRKEMRFTLNGQSEEVGMGLAFSKNGFKPCGGVYACVSFNRREKVQLVIGGNDTDAFHFSPPAGYKAVGEAVLSAFHDMDKLLDKETVIENSPSIADKKPFMCDFSDTEHGHEIFAWQHRYYGSDASVHLGVGRQRQNVGAPLLKKSLKSLMYKQGSKSGGKYHIESTLDLLMTEVWKGASIHAPEDSTSAEQLELIIDNILKSYEIVQKEVFEEFNDNALALCIFYARKFVMHIAISMSSSFDLNWFSPSIKIETARQLITVLELCCSLSSEGWVGEAGTMSMASEALGLAISSNDRVSQQRQAFSSLFEGRKRVDIETRRLKNLNMSASVQVLNFVQLHDADCLNSNLIDPSNSLAACAEFVLGGEGAGAIVFVKDALLSVVASNSAVVDVLLAYISRSVRVLSNIEFQHEDPDDKKDSDANSDNPHRSQQQQQEQNEPDARLTSFLTGLLLSGPLLNTSDDDGMSQSIANSLFEAWMTGLLSQSMPWRMISAMTITTLINICPLSLKIELSRVATIRRLFRRLGSITSRRIWAERAAYPVCSRYLQSLIDLQSSINRVPSLRGVIPSEPCIDAATPSPLKFEDTSNVIMDEDSINSWEAREGWVCSDSSWEVWTGTIEYFAVEWSMPPRSAVRSLMDGGDGPPFLREGCTVLRGLDWNDESSGTLTGEEDGKEAYDREKSDRKKSKKVRQDNSTESPSNPEGLDSDDNGISPPTHETHESSPKNNDKKKKKLPSLKLPVGRVVSVESWKGVPGVARRVRWDLTGEESIYRFGADGGKFDIVHVEVNEKSTRVVKRHPHNETSEQCAVRHGFGSPRSYNILLRVRKSEMQREEFDGEVEHVCDGVLELPDFGAGIEVSCRFHQDNYVTITEGDLIFGTKDSGWEPRFGQPVFVPGTTTVLSPTNVTTSPFLKEDGILGDLSSDHCQYEELLGSSSFSLQYLRNRENGDRVRVASEMRLIRGKVYSKGHERPIPALPPLTFDKDWHAMSLSVSRDQRTITCVSAEGRSTAFLSAGFSKGVHYWEVKIEQADVGSVYVGVAEKPKTSVSGTAQDNIPRLNRWLGWGFVNFRATYNEGSERVYGSHCHAGDTIGVLLDCDSGRLSFFFDGVKYGEHILNDLGCAFENISPFGFNADGCGGGGAGQGAPSGEGGRVGRYPANGSVRPRSLWPVIGLRHPGDRVTISHKWMTNYGVDGSTMLRNALLVDEVLQSYVPSQGSIKKYINTKEPKSIPTWLIQESYLELKRWERGRWYRIETRANGPTNHSSFGLNIDVDVSPLACAAACASLGLHFVLLPGDKVSIKRSAGRILEMPEEAVILGSFLGKLWYTIVSQKSEGGSLKEGGGRAWFWDESEVVDGGLQLMKPIPANKIALPLLRRFNCTSSLRVTYSSGAIMRSDIEILENVSQNIGVIPYDTVIPCEDIIERRMNSNGLVRFFVKYAPIGKGWISYRIRGGSEESVLELIDEKSELQRQESDLVYSCPHECAKSWFEHYELLDLDENGMNSTTKKFWTINSLDEFKDVLTDGIVHGLTSLESDSFLSQIVTSISDHTVTGNALNCPYEILCPALYHALNAHGSLHQIDQNVDCPRPHSVSYQDAASKIGELSRQFPSIKSLLARIAMLRTLNRRAKYAMPLYSIRPSQEDSAVIGGSTGLGASVERLGKSRYSMTGDNWVQAPCIGQRVRKCRELFFTSVKREILNSIVEVTSTPTSLSHDEYELPRDIRTVRVNRLKARKAIETSDKHVKRENTVFGQLQTELRGWSGSALRRGYIAKGHGGQKRAFKVKLIGEGVNDYSGPYREIFTDAIREVNLTKESSESVLGILKPTPNKQFGVGENRNLSMFACVHCPDAQEKDSDAGLSAEESIIRNHYSSHLVAKSEKVRNQEDSLAFLGKLVATAARHGIPMDLELPLETVWKRLCEEDTDTFKSLNEIDSIEHRRLMENSSSIHKEPPILTNQQGMFNSFAEGLSGILPVEIFSIFTGVELRDQFCGNAEIDVELLRKVVEYEGYDENDAVIKYFWETLREMTTHEKKLFLQFVWARSRMPLKESDFEAPFKIQRSSRSSNNDALPSASTCFFSLSLPEYKSKEILREKLLFAIKNVTTMESDYVTNDAEVGEGWRGL